MRKRPRPQLVLWSHDVRRSRSLIAVIAGAATLIAGLGAAGCGSSSSSKSSSTPAATLTKADFVAKANAICGQGDQKLQTAAKAFGNKQPSAAQLAAVEIPNIQAEIAGIRALGAPAGDKAKVSKMIAIAEADLNKAKRNPALLTAKTSVFTNFAKVAHPYGLTACAPTA
jgi:hypothetical protein